MLIVEKTFDEMFRPQEKLHWTKKYYGAWKPEENTYYIIIIAITYVQNPVSFSCIVNNNEFSFCIWAKRMTTIFTFCFCEAYVFLGLREILDYAARMPWLLLSRGEQKENKQISFDGLKLILQWICFLKKDKTLKIGAENMRGGQNILQNLRRSHKNMWNWNL